MGRLRNWNWLISRIEVGDDSVSTRVFGENKVLKNLGDGKKDETGRVGFGFWSLMISLL